MKTYSYSDKLLYFVDKSKNAVSANQAWYFYMKAKNLPNWYELTDNQLAEHKAYIAKYAKSIERKFGSSSKTKTQKPTASAPAPSAPAPKLPKVVEPAVSKNGRTNNALRVKAVIANLEASIEILRAIK